MKKEFVNDTLVKSNDDTGDKIQTLRSILTDIDEIMMKKESKLTRPQSRSLKLGNVDIPQYVSIIITLDVVLY